MDTYAHSRLIEQGAPPDITGHLTQWAGLGWRLVGHTTTVLQTDTATRGSGLNAISSSNTARIIAHDFTWVHLEGS